MLLAEWNEFVTLSQWGRIPVSVHFSSASPPVGSRQAARHSLALHVSIGLIKWGAKLC